MAAVRFAFGAKPGIGEHDARELARLLAGRRTLASARLAGKLFAEAGVDFDRQEMSEDIELDRDELCPVNG
jgi:hypothetical protein